MYNSPAGAAQSSAISRLSPALAWCWGEFWHWLQRAHAWNLTYEGKNYQPWIFWETIKDILFSPQSCNVFKVSSQKKNPLTSIHYLYNLLFLRRWKICGTSHLVEEFLCRDPILLILLMPRFQKAISQVTVTKNTDRSWPEWRKGLEICFFPVVTLRNPGYALN